MITASVLIVLIFVVGVIIMMLIAAVSKRGFELGRGRLVFPPPESRGASLQKERQP